MEAYNTLNPIDKKLLELERKPSELEKLQVEFNQLKVGMTKMVSVVDGVISTLSAQDGFNRSVNGYMKSNGEALDKSKDVMKEIKNMLLKIAETAPGENTGEKQKDVNTTMFA